MSDLDRIGDEERPWLAPSMLDEQYYLPMKEKVDSSQRSFDDIIRRALEAVLGSEEARDVLESQDSQVRYVVDLTPQVKDQIAQGIVRFDYDKDGNVYAQLRDSKNRFGKKLPIKEELIENHVDPQELRIAMQMAAIQEKLDQIVETLDEISEDVADIIRGQQNDRLGLYYSGMGLLMEAREIQDETLRRLVSAQALKSLSDAIGQVTQEILMDIRYLVDGDYKGLRKRRAEVIAERMTNINKCFEVIHRASVLKAWIYYDAGEARAFLLAVEEYSRFIDRAIAPYAGRLAELDQSDRKLIGGKWESRARALEGAEEMRRLLDSSTSFYLEVPASRVEEDEDDAIVG